MKVKSMKVVRVTKTEFELEGGEFMTTQSNLKTFRLSLLSSFSSKIYGKRSAENRRKKKEAEQE